MTRVVFPATLADMSQFTVTFAYSYYQPALHEGGLVGVRRYPV